MPPGYPGGENLWGMAFQPIVDKKHGIFDSFSAQHQLIKRFVYNSYQNEQVN